MYCELEGSIASVTVHSAAWLSCQAKGIIHQCWESWCADHVVLPLLELSVLPHHGLFGVSSYNGNLTALLMQSAQSLHGKVTQGEASLLSLKGLWISVGKRTESSVCFFFFSQKHHLYDPHFAAQRNSSTVWWIQWKRWCSSRSKIRGKHPAVSNKGVCQFLIFKTLSW